MNVNAESPQRRERLIALVIRILGSAPQLPDPFPVDVKLSEIGITSLKMVSLMLAVEAEFEIAIPQSEITPENFHSVATIEALAARLLGPARA